MTVALPATLSALTEGYRWAPHEGGESGGAIFRLEAQGRPSLFLKHGRASVARDILDETTRLAWLAEHLPVPAVRHFTFADDAAWLLSDAIPGRTGDELLADDPAHLDAIVDAAAAFLLRMHAIPAAACPFEAGAAHRLDAARANVAAGRVDCADFDEDHAGWSAERILEETMALLPAAAGRVVTHGDYSLGNLLFEGGRMTGCIDVGRAGLADPYQDIAILWQNLSEYGELAQARFLVAMGITQVDHARLRFHRCLDELF